MGSDGIEDIVNDKTLIKPEVNIKDTNINISNPDIKIPSRAFGAIGIGAAVGAGMNSAASVVKSTGLPVGAKLATVLVGGVGGGAIAVATNAAYSISQSSIESNSKKPPIESTKNGPFSSGSSIEESNINDVFDLLYSNYILHICILYLLIILVILLISNKIVDNKLDFSFMNSKLVRLLLLYANNVVKYNNNILIWLLLILLIIFSIASLFFSYFIYNNIYLISDILSK